MTARQIDLWAGTLCYRDSGTLIPLDQPARLAQLIRELTHQLDTATP
jgi:hypothetical protein